MLKQRVHIVPLIALATAGCLWGTGFFFGKVALTEMSVPDMVLFRLAWIIHEVSSQKRKDALKGMMNTGFAHPASPFGASIA